MIYRDALPADGPPLSAMAQRCFSDTFGSLYRAEDLAAFLDRSFGADGLPSQLDDPAYAVRLALEGDAIAGFAKIGPVVFPGDWGSDAIELHQLYVLGPWQGAGVAPILVEWAIATARARNATRMLLSVFVDNVRAQRFYARYGFVEVGKYEFRVGDHVDDDRIWALDL
ncbi:GNAT family N-acetyltransferase [Sphingomonas sp. M1-B02]|uniref:GNAT family N-acetyltransferase n=1 Tax=Sphingomonas sp. M1-B02 TaxID=3114300 RepID=UPI00223FFF0F|nr:GNAT family N-acetyltransferase [Sphingomonas sp. S6-11]UZK65723.1 GNAT family N-acetyltransferase [Sphingomonas sp. S6-11]